MKEKIEILVRAVIRSTGKILVCNKIGKNYFFLPGGHVEFGENAGEALARELNEELGIKIKKPSLIGGSEYVFIENGKKRHEINLIFNVKINKITTESKEKHLQFFLFDRKQFVKENILPTIIRDSVLKWLENQKFFWADKEQSTKL